MKTFLVEVQRTETIYFEVEAEDENEAQMTYLHAGDEIASKTTMHDVISVEACK